MRMRTLQTLAALLSCIGMIVPTAALAADVPVQSAMTPSLTGIDIALADGGLFVGQVVDLHGAAQAESEVALVYQGKEVVRTVTDENGMFAARGLRGGQYEIVSAGGVVPCRLWADRTAPPSARQSALIVTGAEAVNGQYGSLGQPGGVLSWMQAHPIIVAGAVVTAIAVPLAIANDDDSTS